MSPLMTSQSTLCLQTRQDAVANEPEGKKKELHTVLPWTLNSFFFHVFKWHKMVMALKIVIKCASIKMNDLAAVKYFSPNPSNCNL